MDRFDLLIKGGQVLDGTGNPWFKADIGIEGNKIACIYREMNVEAEEIVNAEGLTVSPGFIDAHAHDDLYLLKYPSCDGKVSQGVTTTVIGNCGFSPAPLSDEHKEDALNALSILGAQYIDKEVWSMRSFGDYLKKLDALELGINVVPLVGHATVRIAVMGTEMRAPTQDELERMKLLVAEAMGDGAFGISTGLIYTPANYATAEEIREVSRPVKRYAGIYATHIRGEGDSLIPAVAEAIRIGEETGIPVHIAHHKASGRKNWGKSEETLSMLTGARGRGVEATCDQYPYDAGSTFLTALLPPSVLAGGAKAFCERLRDATFRKKAVEEIEKHTEGQRENFIQDAGWDGIVISYSKNHSNFTGKSIAEISRMENKNPYDVVFDIIIEEKYSTTIVLFLMGDGDIRKIMGHPLTMIGSDGIPDFGEGKPHPRFASTFPRVLGRYVRERKVIGLEEAVRKMTSLTAQTFRIGGKGLLKEGFDADAVIFDPETIIDRATYEDPRQKPEGINYVIVNGKIVVRGGKITGTPAGKVLRHRGERGG